jgi:hypothetical protein
LASNTERQLQQNHPASFGPLAYQVTDAPYLALMPSSRTTRPRSACFERVRRVNCATLPPSICSLRSAMLLAAHYLRIDLTDDAAPHMDTGLVVAGHFWRLQCGTAYSIREGRVMLDRRDHNPYTTAESVVPAIVNPRMAAFTLPALSTAESHNQHRDILRRLGAAQDTPWIAELTDNMTERNRRAIGGGINASGEDAAISRDSLRLATRGFRVVERISGEC